MEIHHLNIIKEEICGDFTKEKLQKIGEKPGETTSYNCHSQSMKIPSPHPTAFMPISRPQELDIAGVHIGIERLLHDSPFWAQGVARKTAQKMVK